MPKNKRVRQRESVTPQKRVRMFPGVDIEGMPMAWRFGSGDRGGLWAWTQCQDAAYEILTKLGEFEKLSFAELGRNGSHWVNAENICKEARDRLVKIEQDDVDQLFSFRLTNTCRVWCITEGNMMRVLWWDPQHTVWPTGPNV